MVRLYDEWWEEWGDRLQMLAHVKSCQSSIAKIQQKIKRLEDDKTEDRWEQANNHIQIKNLTRQKEEITASMQNPDTDKTEPLNLDDPGVCCGLIQVRLRELAAMFGISSTGTDIQTLVFKI